MCVCIENICKKRLIRKIKKGKFIRREQVKKIVVTSDSLIPVLEANIRMEIGRFKALIESNKIDRNNMTDLTKGICNLRKKMINSVRIALFEIEVNERVLAA